LTPRLLVLCLAIGTVALLGLWRPAASGAVCFRVSAKDPLDCFKTPTYRYMLLNVVLQGDFDYTRVQDGQDQNACGDGSNTTPNSSTESYGFNFDVVWYHLKVPFAPVKGGRGVKVYKSGKSTISGTYLFHGMDYDEDCNQVTWPAGSGQSACQGQLAATSQKLGLNFVNYPSATRPDKNHVVIDMQPVPLDALSATPAGCNDSDGQFHSYDELSGGESPDALVSLNVSNRSLGGRRFVHGPVALRVQDPAGFITDCSVPSAQLGCHETWTGTAHAYVYRVGVIP
jgi:hypothetical protein